MGAVMREVSWTVGKGTSRRSHVHAGARGRRAVGRVDHPPGPQAVGDRNGWRIAPLERVDERNGVLMMELTDLETRHEIERVPNPDGGAGPHPGVRAAA